MRIYLVPVKSDNCWLLVTANSKKVLRQLLAKRGLSKRLQRGANSPELWDIDLVPGGVWYLAAPYEDKSGVPIT